MKDGFSLIEVIVSITIVLLLSLLVFPSLIKISNETRQKAYNSKVKIILATAKEWGYDNINSLSSECSNLFVRDLIKEGYIDGDAEEKTVLKDPLTNGSMNNMIVCVTYEYINEIYRIKTVIVE